VNCMKSGEPMRTLHHGAQPKKSSNGTAGASPTDLTPLHEENQVMVATFSDA
jgi:hypothetical protein